MKALAINTGIIIVSHKVDLVENVYQTFLFKLAAVKGSVRLIRPREYIIFFMLNSAEHVILYVHKYKSIKKFSIFQAQISLQHYFPAHKC